jgi:hypothetical protein
LEGYIYNADLRDAEYDEWLKSDDFINMINEELDRAKPIYSQYDIAYALNYAKSGIIVEASEIGSDVYNTLFSEKVFEYLNKLYER